MNFRLISSGLLLACFLILAGCNVSTVDEFPAEPTQRVPIITRPANMQIFATNTPWPASATPVLPMPSPPIAISATAVATANLPAGWSNVAEVVDGICFAAINDAAGQVFVMRSPADLTQLFILADFSELCQRPVERKEADFSGNAALLGFWSRGRGCSAQHTILSHERDDEKQRIAMEVLFTTMGTCPYELVRPFWVRVPDAASYAFEVRIVP